MTTYYEYNGTTGFLIGTYEVPPEAVRPNSTTTDFAPIPPIRAKWDGFAWVNDPAQENQIAAENLLLNTQPWGSVGQGRIRALTGAASLLPGDVAIITAAANATYTLPISPEVGSVIIVGCAPFATVGASLATLDAGVGVKIAGRTRYLALTHENAVVLRWSGVVWQAPYLDLDSPWVNGGLITFGAVSVAPTKGTTTRDVQWWSRSGTELLLRYEYRQTTIGTNGTGIYLFTLPGTFGVDTNVCGVNSTINDYEAHSITLGTSRYLRGADSHNGAPSMFNATQFRISGLHLANPVASSDNVSISSSIGLGNADVGFSLQARIPILNW